MVDVSVVVPFFNPGANIEDCLASLNAQTLAGDRYEVLLVDDGSTDGSEQRVQRYVDMAPDRFRMIRIPASGWPGRPRNVGVDAAHGRYLQFVDSDDSLDPNALQRLLDVALDSDADIVVGKLTSDFRGLNHHVFRHTVTGRTVYDYPLVDTLTPHKMVRKALLTDHAIRFAEGPRHVEDEHFSMQIYTRAKSVAVVGDLACYFYRRRRVSGLNLGDTEAVAADYFRDLAAVLDVIDAHVADPAARIPLQRRFYRNEMLGRLRGKAMVSYADGYRREVLDAVRDLAMTRFAPEVREQLPCFVRTQSRLMLDDDIRGLTTYSSWLEDVELVATTATPVWLDGRLTVAIDALLQLGDRPLKLQRDGSDWVVPETVARDVARADRLVSDGDLAAADLDCATISRADSQQWSTTDGLALSIADDGRIVVRGKAALDPATLQGGRPLTAGLWDLRLRVAFGGLVLSCPLRPEREPATPAAWVVPTDGGPRAVQPFWTSPATGLALDVDCWSHPLTELIDDRRAPVVRGRELEVDLAGLAGPPAAYPAQLLLTSDGPPSPAISLPATLAVSEAGAVLHTRLPRRLAGSSHQLWVRINELGGAAPRPLSWWLVKESRQFTIVSSPLVHLTAE